MCKIKEPANLKAETVFSQGSFLGLNLKLLFGTVIKNYNTFHSYTDGTQLYLSFPSNLAPVHTLSCTDEINCWMSRYYFIELNRNKTYLLLLQGNQESCSGEVVSNLMDGSRFANATAVTCLTALC